MGILPWKRTEFGGDEAVLTNPDGTVGVRFSLEHYPTCYRRGPWKLLIEIEIGRYHIAWGCFDLQDQPMRWYLSRDNALAEAELIGKVLLKDFKPERVHA
jgi:hypothetical protein